MGLLAIRRRRQGAASQALLNGVLENAPVGLGFLDRSLRVRHVNRALSDMGDRALRVELGSMLWDALPELRSVLEKRTANVLEGGDPVEDVEFLRTGSGPAAPTYVFRVGL